MNKIRCINEIVLCVSVNDVFSNIKEELKLTDEQCYKAEWNFRKRIFHKLYNGYKYGCPTVNIIILKGKDLFVDWSCWGYVYKYLPSSKRKSHILESIDSPQEIPHYDLFQIIE